MITEVGGSNPFEIALGKAVGALELSLSSHHIGLLGKHFDAIVSTNRSMNLTRITDPAEAAVMLYADSLSVVAWARQNHYEPRTLLDIGTGAGFPAVALAVAQPEWRITAIDSTRKKIDFLVRTLAQLELTNLELHHAHSDHWASERSFDLVVLKAFGPLAKCVEQAVRFLARGGRIVAFKTPALPDDERNAAKALCKRLALAVEEPFAYRLPWESGTLERLLCTFRRVD